MPGWLRCFWSSHERGLSKWAFLVPESQSFSFCLRRENPKGKEEHHAFDCILGESWNMPKKDALHLEHVLLISV